MRWIIIGMIGFLFMGCTPQPVDISSAYWKDKKETRNQTFPDWPDWQKVAHKGVSFGKNKSWASEYVTFLWDESGIYGEVFAFCFPEITLYPEDNKLDNFIHVHLMATTPNNAFCSHGKVKAFCLENDKYVAVSSEEFKTRDCGCVMKPGQCITDFWISWDALNPKGTPIKTSIRVKDRKLILDPAGGGNNGNE